MVFDFDDLAKSLEDDYVAGAAIVVGFVILSVWLLVGGSDIQNSGSPSRQFN